MVRICDRIGVMYAGELVEEGPITEVFRNPRHPYTRGLLSCIPSLGADKNSRPLTADPRPGALDPEPAEGLRLPAALHASPSRTRCSQEPLPTLNISERHRVQMRAGERAAGA